MARNKLSDCDILFRKFFDRWYTKEDREHRPYTATRPDMEQLSIPPGAKASELSPLTATTIDEVQGQISSMRSAAADDWPTYLKVSAPISLEWIAAFDSHYDRDAVQKVVARSQASDFSNDYVVLCCELGAILGEVLLQQNRRLQWLYDRPYWESAIFDPGSNFRVNVFHWAVKKMSDYGVEDGLVGKIQGCLQRIEETS